MEKAESDAGKGTLVLATVRGDVHDIGKNLVDIILTNNGYEVHNIGIKVSIAEMNLTKRNCSSRPHLPWQQPKCLRNQGLMTA